MKGLIWPSTTPVKPVKPKPPDKKLFLLEVTALLILIGARTMGAWTLPRPFTHDPQLLIAQEWGIEWLLR